MRFLLLQKTDTDEIRKAIQLCVQESKYAKDHRRMVKELANLFPFENWTERSLAHLLYESAQIPITRANQIMEILYPTDKADLTVEELESIVHELRDMVDQFAIEERKALRDNKIGPEEMQLFKIRATQVNNLFQKFLNMCNTHINIELS